MSERLKMHKFFYLNIFLLLWAVFALTNSGFDTSEGRYHYQIAEQIIKHRQLSFDTWEAIGLKNMPLNCCFTLSSSGKIYGTHEIGNTLFYLPTAFVNILLEKLLSGFVSADKIFELKEFVFSFQASFYSALTATTFLGILRVGFSQRLIPSLLATSGLIFTTFFWTYTRSSFDGVLCSTLLTLSLLFLLVYDKKRRWIYLIISFICLGFSLITRLTMFLPILASVIYLTNLSRTSLIEAIKRVFVASLTLVPFVIWQLWYNQLRTGKFYASPVQSNRYLEYNGLDGNLLVGLQGLILSPGKSIFIYAPLLILSILLLRRFYKLYKREAMYVILVTVFWLLLHSKLRSWYGAWGWGPRHFITILPIMFLPFAVNIEYIMKNTVRRSWALILAGFGFVLALASIISNWHFRMTYAKERGLLSDDIFVWGFWNSQSLDMLKGAATNIIYILAGMPIIETQTNSLANEYASSTINVWYNTLIFLKTPWYVVVLLVMPLIALVVIEIRNIKSILGYTSDKFK